MTNYAEFLAWKYNGCTFTMSDPYDYDTLVWNSDIEKPTKEQIDNKVALIVASSNKVAIDNRVKEYPPIGDQLDALFHAGVFPEEMATKIQAVKDKYPKS